MAKPRVLVLRAPGTNCDEETVHGWQLAGADAACMHVNRLAEHPGLLEPFQVLTLPGGFSYGDDIAAGRVLARLMRDDLMDAVRAHLDRGGGILGICNGFQVLVQTGLLPGGDIEPGRVTVTHNVQGQFEARWVRLRTGTRPCAFLPPDDILELPIEHAEGRVVTKDTATLERLHDAGHVAVRYVAPDESDQAESVTPRSICGDRMAGRMNAGAADDANGRDGGRGRIDDTRPATNGGDIGRNTAGDRTVDERTDDAVDQYADDHAAVDQHAVDHAAVAALSARAVLPYPINPNGSQADIAGLCDPTGRVLGLMPHPDRHLDRTNHPLWTRRHDHKTPDGLRMFQHAVAYWK